MSVQGDHVHVVLRTTRRSGLQNFLRVFSGQIAQRFMKEGLLASSNTRGVTDTARQGGRMKKLWKYRPFTRVVKGRKAHVTVHAYVELNEKEAQGKIPYRKDRLRGLEQEEWKILWS